MANATSSAGLNYTQPDGSLLFPFAANRFQADFQDFFQAYCINPPDDTCYEPGRCSNPDAAGILVRVAAYGTNFFMGTLILYSPKEATGTFWNLMLFMYSILITSSISIYNRTLTRFHAEVSSELAGSPLICVLFAYVIINLVSKRKHRMDHVLGGKFYHHPLPKLSVVGGIALWLGVVFFTVRQSHNSFFRQSACDPRTALNQFANGLAILPYAAVVLIICSAFLDGGPLMLIFAAPIVIVVITSVIILLMRRNTIRALGDGKYRFWVAWTYFAHQYPFIHFLGVYGFSFFYWMFIIEGRMVDTHDNHFQLSFGQILALFSVVEPLVQNIKLLPRFARWFIDLAWVRLITFRPQKQSNVQRLKEELDPETMSLKRPFVKHGDSRDSTYSFHSKAGSAVSYEYNALPNLGKYEEPDYNSSYRPFSNDPFKSPEPMA